MKKLISLLIATIFALSFGSVFCSAKDEETAVRDLVVISNRSDSFTSTEQVLDDFLIGADMVSVSVEVNDDELVLASLGGTSAMMPLSHLVALLPEGKRVILDGISDYPEIVNSFLKDNECAEKVIVRGNNTDPTLFDCEVIDVYSGGIVFSALSKVKNSNGFVQFQSKNYFNPFYQKIVTKLFDKYNVTAIAPMYSPDLCGQREDNNTGWDEMIDRGFNAIETGNIAGLCKYREALLLQQMILIDMYSDSFESIGESGEYIEIYTQTSYNNYLDALREAENTKSSLSSLARTQKAYSKLVYAQNHLATRSEKETIKGEWNVTAGKVIACVLCAAGLVGFELFLKKKKGRIKIG